MSDSTFPHVVREGEHLYRIAASYGLTVDEIWNLDANASLREAGRTPEILLAGDVLCIPEVAKAWLPVEVGAVNRFTGRVLTVNVELKLVGADGAAAAGEAYEVESLGLTGNTDAHGTLSLHGVPVDVTRLGVRLTKRNVTLMVTVGALDPIDTTSGQVQRLAHLGYLPGGTRIAPEHTLEIALERFRQDQAPDAESEDDVRAALLSAHGS